MSQAATNVPNSPTDKGLRVEAHAERLNNLVDKKPAELDRETGLMLFRDMTLGRRFEDKCAEMYYRGKMFGFVHLYNGQEAVSSGVIGAMKLKHDWFCSTYRDHVHALSAGVPAREVMSELFGKETGCSKGRGGSMHLFDASRNFMGGHAIVGGQLPVSAGLALAQKYKKTDGITVCFFGDGATNQGVYHETLNLASIWKLPILFILENNGYGMGSSIERVRAGGVDFFPGVSTYDIESTEVDGMDVLAVVESVSNAID